MDNPEPKSSNKTKAWLKFILCLGLVLLVGYAVFTTLMLRNLTNERNYNAKREIIRSQLPAQSCGVLSPDLARTTIDKEELKRDSRTVEGIAYEDGCTYTAVSNSNEYASLVIKTYSNNADARDYYEKDRKIRIESENRDPESFGDEMYYSAGSFYVLNGNQIYAVSAAREGISKDEQEAFSRQLLEKTVTNINL